MIIHIARSDKQLGAFEAAELPAKLSAEEILVSDLAWTAGENSWTSLSELANKYSLPLTTLQPPELPTASKVNGEHTAELHVPNDQSPPHPSFRAGAVIARACPRCESTEIKKISLIVQEGTTDYERTSSVSGSAYVGSSYIPVSGTRTDSGTSKTRLAAMLSEELQMEDGNALGFWGLLFLIIAVVAGFYVGHYFSSSMLGWGFGVVTFIACSAAWTSIKPSKAVAERNAQLDRWRENGHYCHRCSHRFIPGSSEPYPYLSGNAE